MHRPKKFDPPWIDFFTNPCPYFLSQTKQFQCFSKLPKELQLMIWKEAIGDGRIVPINLHFDVDKMVPLLRRYSDWEGRARFLASGEFRQLLSLRPADRPPAVMSACRDSRAMAKKVLSPAFAAQTNSRMFFNFSKDVLHFQWDSAARLFCERSPNFGISRTHLESMRSLALSFNAIPNIVLFILIFRAFTKLKEVVIISDVPDTEKQPFDLAVEMNNVWGSLMNKKAAIAAMIEANGGKGREWKMPKYRFVRTADLPDILDWHNVVEVEVYRSQLSPSPLLVYY
jgi:hypothetical protein